MYLELFLCRRKINFRFCKRRDSKVTWVKFDFHQYFQDRQIVKLFTSGSKVLYKVGFYLIVLWLL